MWFLPLLIVIPLLAFWTWMFSDMIHNESLPPASNPPLTWPPRSKYAWIWAFIVLNFLGAALYYLTVYKEDD